MIQTSNVLADTQPWEQDMQIIKMAFRKPSSETTLHGWVNMLFRMFEGPFFPLYGRLYEQNLYL